MPWNTPATWLSAALTSAQLNAQVRDNFKAIGDPWTAYTPGWFASTAPAIGNGTLTGNYMQAGKLVHFRIRLVAGSTTTFGVGAWTFGLPVAAVVGLDNVLHCNVLAKDVAPSARYLRSAYLNSATALAPCDAAGVLLQSTSPFTWATGDILSIAGTYEAA